MLQPGVVLPQVLNPALLVDFTRFSLAQPSGLSNAAAKAMLPNTNTPPAQHII